MTHVFKNVGFGRTSQRFRLRLPLGKAINRYLYGDSMRCASWRASCLFTGAAIKAKLKPVKQLTRSDFKLVPYTTSSARGITCIYTVCRKYAIFESHLQSHILMVIIWNDNKSNALWTCFCSLATYQHHRPEAITSFSLKAIGLWR